jgi:hypothetical protein
MGEQIMSLHEITIIKWGTQGKGMAMICYPFTGIEVVVEKPSYRINNHTIKRSFGWIT